MDNEIPLARQENIRRPVLLGSTGPRTTGQGALCRAEGQKASGHVRRYPKGSPISAAQAGKGYAKAKGGNGRGGKHGRAYSLRESIREAEGRNPAPGRTAKELGIEWPGERCEESPVTHAHWFTGRTYIDGGVIFECKFCHKVKWLPTEYEHCYDLGAWQHIYGLTTGYQRMLDLHPSARRLLSKIQDIYYLRKAIPPEQFPLAIASVMLDREYPYDVEIKEEDIL